MAASVNHVCAPTLTTIRPTGPQPAPQARPASGDGSTKLAAQQAFFAALGKVQAPAAAPAQATAPAAPAVAQAIRPAAPAEAPQRILRPGSLIDIRV